MKLSFSALSNHNTLKTAGVKLKPAKRKTISNKQKRENEKLKDATKELAKFFYPRK
jgi:hypothetical protein